MTVAAVLIAACVHLSAGRYQLPEPLLWSILEVEGGRPGTVARNRNGTEDLGPMQVNSAWLAEFSRLYASAPLMTGRAEAERRQLLRRMLADDPCFNIGIAAWILRRSLDEAGAHPGDPAGFWRGVGYYHSHRTDLTHRYQRLVAEAARRLYGDTVFAAAEADDGMVQGFGKGQPLYLVIRQIVPKSVPVRLGRGTDAAAPLSWDTGRQPLPWRQVLEEALQNSGLAVVDEGGGIVIEAAASRPAEPAADASRQWTAAAGVTLRETLTRWAADSGWTVDWTASARDRLFGASAQFSGDFETAADSLLRTFTTGPGGLRAQFHQKNRVLEIWAAGMQDH